jgi:hypothetical protein
MGNKTPWIGQRDYFDILLDRHTILRMFQRLVEREQHGGGDRQK